MAASAGMITAGEEKLLKCPEATRVLVCVGVGFLPRLCLLL